ncbi:hypothetical protein KUDE01_003913 [Dissostichus eleginoides]|uniref:Uncharacterized protein n=1 Tax=Dissostichus eleginoides TaxID=100907 RepID=A0AAD9CGZ0_DISEL|nr:hypothetical protein KUDE01_003913 [Dissostichus eleginoides]
MNVSSLNSTSPGTRSFAAAAYKNVIVTVLCIAINYINGTLIHTFRKHQVCVCVCVHTSIHSVYLLCRVIMRKNHLENNAVYDMKPAVS